VQFTICERWHNLVSHGKSDGRMSAQASSERWVLHWKRHEVGQTDPQEPTKRLLKLHLLGRLRRNTVRTAFRSHEVYSLWPDPIIAQLKSR
jgi:hypothetical protein